MSDIHELRWFVSHLTFLCFCRKKIYNRRYNQHQISSSILRVETFNYKLANVGNIKKIQRSEYSKCHYLFPSPWKLCDPNRGNDHISLCDYRISCREMYSYTRLLWFVHSKHSANVLIKTDLISFQIKLVSRNLYYLIKPNATGKWNIRLDWLPTNFNLTKLHFALILHLISYTPKQIKCFPLLEWSSGRFPYRLGSALLYVVPSAKYAKSNCIREKN